MTWRRCRNNVDIKLKFDLLSIRTPNVSNIWKGILYKADTGPLENADPIPKFTARVKTSILTNSGVLISNMTIAFFKFDPRKTKIKHFLVPNLGILIFSRNFASRHIWGCWFQMWQYYFQISFQKYSNKAYLVPNLRVFILEPNFTTRQIRGHWFQIWQ